MFRRSHAILLKHNPRPGPPLRNRQRPAGSEVTGFVAGRCRVRAYGGRVASMAGRGRGEGVEGCAGLLTLVVSTDLESNESRANGPEPGW